jgi:hypothetical protein
MASTLGFLAALGSTQPNCLNSGYSVHDRARSIDEERLERAEHAALGGTNELEQGNTGCAIVGGST